jgi:hypothetical protein
MLRSADTFCDPGASELTVELRRQLLDRLGVFGVRFCVDEIRSNRSATATELAQALVAESGLDALRALITERFLPRAHILQARTALVGLRSIARTGDRRFRGRRLARTRDVRRRRRSSPSCA